MSMTQTMTEMSPSGNLHCPKCKAVLLPKATFCTSCGERVAQRNIASLLQNDLDIATRYRITSLVRRRPHISLFFAIDNQQQRPVALRQITIRDLSDEAQAFACEVVQREYDLLRLHHIPSVMPVIDLRHFQGQLYVVAGWPTNKDEIKSDVHPTRLYTLQDVLQSGVGLPDMSVALTWTEQLCSALQHLHHYQIVIGDLDPEALILCENSYNSELALMVSWLPSAIRNLLSRTSAINSSMNFTAPEVLLGKPEPRSDIYSLGAILYFLLTSTPPEEPSLRLQRRLRPPGEINSRISSSLDEFVMQALALESSERFQSAYEMAETLSHVRSGVRRTSTIPKRPTSASIPSISQAQVQAQTQAQIQVQAKDTDAAPSEQKIEEIADIETILITPEASLAAWQAMKSSASNARPQASEQLSTTVEGTIEQYSNQGTPQADDQATKREPARDSRAQNFKKRITGILPAITFPHPQAAQTSRPLQPSQPLQAAVQAVQPSQPLKALPKPAPSSTEPPTEPSNDKDASWLKQLQHLILGEQNHATAAAAIIETPLRVQPNQPYTIRIQLMGRDKPRYPHPVQARKGAGVGGLSALVEGDLVYIEVRSVLYQSYAYIVQQASVHIPSQGYAAEVTIPMHPLSSGPSGRRDRLHIFFMDEMRRPLYEKPFVVELFISHLVQPGREGHNVLTIPL